MRQVPAQSPIGLKAALGGYALVFVLKIVAWWLTGLFALLAEALHTLSDLEIGRAHV